MVTMQLLAIVILLQFHTALSAGTYGTCDPPGNLTVNTSTMSVNAAAYGGAASFQYEIVRRQRDAGKVYQ